MRVIVRCVGWVGGCMFFLVLVVGAVISRNQTKSIKLRISDVQLLTRACLEMRIDGSLSNAQMGEVIRKAQGYGDLYSPIIVNTKYPCYQLGSIFGGTNGLSARDVVVEESDNVSDKKFRVRSYGDGHVALETR